MVNYMNNMNKIGVLFICLGNICRSPTAEGVFRKLVQDAGLDVKINIDSAGTSQYHIGVAPDARATAYAAERGYDLAQLRARQVSRNDFYKFEYILAMDELNLLDLQLLQPEDSSAIISLILDYKSDTIGSETQVPDPYFGGEQGFNHVLNLLEDASENLLSQLRAKHQLNR